MTGNAVVARFATTFPSAPTAAVTPVNAAAWYGRPAHLRLGLPYPAQVTAPVTRRAIITDALSWIGLGSLTSGVPTPATPVNDFLAGMWVDVRRLHYTLHNSFPTLRPSPSTANPVTGVVTGNLGGGDVDGDVLTYAVSNPSHGTVEIARDGTYTYTPDAGFAHSGGIDRFTASVADTANPWHIYGFAGIIHHIVDRLWGLGLTTCDTKVVTVSVPAGFVNAAPIAGTPEVGAANASTGVVAGSVAVSDADGDIAAFVTRTAPLRGTVQVDSTSGAFVYTPNAEFRHAASANGATASDLSDTFVLAISDGYGGTTPVSVTGPHRPGQYLACRGRPHRQHAQRHRDRHRCTGHHRP